jgi:hypothetical protein
MLSGHESWCRWRARHRAAALSYQAGKTPAPPLVAPAHHRVLDGITLRSPGPTVKSSIGMAATTPRSSSTSSGVEECVTGRSNSSWCGTLRDGSCSRRAHGAPPIGGPRTPDGAARGRGRTCTNAAPLSTPPREDQRVDARLDHGEEMTPTGSAHFARRPPNTPDAVRPKARTRVSRCAIAGQPRVPNARSGVATLTLRAPPKSLRSTGRRTARASSAAPERQSRRASPRMPRAPDCHVFWRARRLIAAIHHPGPAAPRSR